MAKEQKESLEAVFPELKESEDEKIRKEIGIKEPISKTFTRVIEGE